LHLSNSFPELRNKTVATLSEEVDRSLWPERLIAALASFFGAFASLLSAIGLYGLLAYLVARRQPEIGLRLALGADSWQVIRPLMRRLAPMLAVGFIIGAALSWCAGSLVHSLLYQVQVFDLAAEIPALVLVVAIGVLGAAVPALRAIRVDPSTALRGD
jgi:ABC-type antimicrobial peptide transport system permease subunit